MINIIIQNSGKSYISMVIDKLERVHILVKTLIQLRRSTQNTVESM